MTARTARPGPTTRTLTPRQAVTGSRRLHRQTAANPLRRVRLDCHGWVRDPSATTGDWVWCAHPDCADWRRVAEVAE